MKITIMLIALALTVVPSVLVASGIIADPMQKGLTLIGTILWFATAPFWIKREESA